LCYITNLAIVAYPEDTILTAVMMNMLVVVKTIFMNVIPSESGTE